MAIEDLGPYRLFGFTFGISSVAGLAALLRSGKPMSPRLIVSAFLNSGLFGTGVAMIWFELYGGATHPWFMLGVAALAGLGGTSLLDLAIQTVRHAIVAYGENAVKSAFPRPGQQDRQTKADDHDTPQTH